MYLELNERENELFHLLSELPPDFEAAERFLVEWNLSPQEVTRVAIAYVREYHWDVDSYAFDRGIPYPKSFVPGLHTSYICAVFELLLKYGLDPNYVDSDENNLMSSLECLEHEYIAADALSLLLAHG